MGTVWIKRKEFGAKAVVKVEMDGGYYYFHAEDTVGTAMPEYLFKKLNEEKPGMYEKADGLPKKEKEKEKKIKEKVSSKIPKSYKKDIKLEKKNKK